MQEMFPIVFLFVSFAWLALHNFQLFFSDKNISVTDQ